MTTTDCKFFIPGPTWVRPEILAEMTRPMIGHRSAEFRELFHGIRSRLKRLFVTDQHTFVVTSSGTGVMQAALENCVKRRVLVTTAGAFGERWHSIAQSLGYEVDHLDAGWGNAVDPQDLADHLAGRRGHYDAVTITHNETSTGVMSDLAALSEVVHTEAPDALVLVDAVSSLGGAPLHFDEWRLDVCLASVQKGLALPPGITVVATSARAMEAASRHPYRGLYFDLTTYKAKADEDGVPSTPSIPHFFALAKQLEDIEKEGLEARWARHVAMRDLTLQRTARYARPAADPGHASPTVTALLPSKSPDLIRAEMKKRGYTLGGGYGEWKETTFRIGHMGDMPLSAVEGMLDVLDEVATA